MYCIPICFSLTYFSFKCNSESAESLKKSLWGISEWICHLTVKLLNLGAKTVVCIFFFFLHGFIFNIKWIICCCQCPLHIKIHFAACTLNKDSDLKGLKQFCNIFNLNFYVCMWKIEEFCSEKSTNCSKLKAKQTFQHIVFFSA